MKRYYTFIIDAAVIAFQSIFAHKLRAFLTLLGIIFGVASVVVARYIGPTGKGTLAVLNVITGLAMQVGNLGLHAATAHFAARERESVARIAWASLLLAPAIGVVIAAGLGIVIAAFPVVVSGVPSLLVVISLLSIPFAFLFLFFQNILLGQNRIGVYNLLDVGGKIVVLPLVLVILLFLKGGLQELVLAGFFLSAVMSLVTVRRL